MDHDTILCLGCLSWKALLYACAGTNQAIEDTLFPNNRPFQAFPVFNVIDDIFAFKCWCWFGTNTTLFNGALIETMKATRRNRLKVYRSVFGLKIDILYLIFAPRSLGKTLHWGASAGLLQRLSLVALIVKQSTDTSAGSIHLSQQVNHLDFRINTFTVSPLCKTLQQIGRCTAPYPLRRSHSRYHTWITSFRRKPTLDPYTFITISRSSLFPNNHPHRHHLHFQA